MLSLLPQQPLLTRDQIQLISNILANAGQVIFGTTIVSPLLLGFDKINWSVVLFGTGVLIACWTSSVVLAKRKEIDNEF